MEESKAVSDAPETTDTVVAQENVQDTEVAAGASDSVKYETYARKKKLADNLAAAKRELEDKLAKMEQEKYEAEGNKDKVIEALRKQVDSLSTEKKQLFGNFAYNSVTNQIAAEASKLGCVDTEALVRLMDIDTFMEGVDTETFKANMDEVKMAIEDQKKKRAYLFDKQGPKINTSSPQAELTAQKTKSSSDMSVDELKQRIRELDSQIRG